MADIKGPDDVRSRADLAAFLRGLAREAATGEVENAKTADYLEAASAWAVDCEGAYTHAGEEVPELSPEAWRFVARLLDTALFYE